MNRIGEGGMGVVFKTMHRRMERLVALKVLKRSATSADFVKRFHREIHVAARLNHPNAVAALDADECELADFWVMEFVDGADLDQVVEKSGPLSVAETVAAVRQAALGLSHAHEQGVVHYMSPEQATDISAVSCDHAPKLTDLHAG